MVNRVPLPTLKRFSTYISIIEEVLTEEWISTSYLSSRSKTPAITIRKDIGYLGLKGIPKKGYKCDDLYNALVDALGGESTKDLIIIGTYGLGGFYLKNPDIFHGGYKIRAAFDFIDHEDLSGSIPIYPFERLKDLVNRLGVSIALVSFKETPVALLSLRDWGIKGVMNLNDTELNIGIPEVNLSPSSKISELAGIISSNKGI